MKRLALMALGLSFSAHAASFTSNPYRSCAQLVRTSTAQVLVLEAEGFQEYTDADANAIFDYTSQRKLGPVAGALPPLGSTGVLTDGLLFPLAQEFGDRINIVSFDIESDDPSPSGEALACAQMWMKNSAHKLVLIGHSHGASRVINLTTMLAQQGIGVNTLITIDGLLIQGGELARPQGVMTYLNFYQNHDQGLFQDLFNGNAAFIYRGQAVQGTDNVKQLVTDTASHFTIPGSPTVIAAVKAQIEKLVGPAKVASAAN